MRAGEYQFHIFSLNRLVSLNLSYPKRWLWPLYLASRYIYVVRYVEGYKKEATLCPALASYCVI